MSIIRVGPSRSFTSINSALASIGAGPLPGGLTEDVDIRVDPGTYQTAGTGSVVNLGDVINNGFRVTVEPDLGLLTVILDAQNTNLAHLMWTNNSGAKNFTVRGLDLINPPSNAHPCTLQQIGANTYEGNILELCRVQVTGAVEAFFNLGSGVANQWFIVRNCFAYTPVGVVSPSERGVNFAEIQGGICGLELIGNTFNRFDKGAVFASSAKLPGVIMRGNIFTGIVTSFVTNNQSFLGSAVVTNNLYYSVTAANWTHNATTYNTLGDWQAGESVDFNSIAGQDPLVSDLSDPHLRAGSPAIGGFVPIGALLEEWDGYARHNPTDIGADEFSGAIADGLPLLGVG